MENNKAYFHLPGLFEFLDLYKIILPLFYEHREYFYEWCEIGSIYGAPADCIWSGGRVGFGDDIIDDVISLMSEYNISSRLTFSNSLLEEKHLSDKKCNEMCEKLNKNGVKNGIIVHSDLLLNYLKQKYDNLYFVSSTTKVITDFEELKIELNIEEFDYVVPDFRFNNRFDKLNTLLLGQKQKLEFLCNECCDIRCNDRKECYENVSKKSLGIEVNDHICSSPDGYKGYRFSKAMQSPAFIGVNDILENYLPNGLNHFKIEGRGLGSALILEFILYYMTKPEYQINVREKVYLDSMLDLF